MEKTCIACKESKPATAEHFYLHKKMRDGLLNKCIACHNAQNAERYKQKAESIKAERREYYSENREKAYASAKRYRAANLEKVRSRESRYRARNREKKAATNAAYRKRNEAKLRARAKVREALQRERGIHWKQLNRRLCTCHRLPLDVGLAQPWQGLAGGPAV